MNIDELKLNETLISCPFCGFSIITADLSDDDLQTLINTEHIPVDCSDCTGTFMIGIDLTVEEVYRCRECGDLGEIYSDAFSPVAGHYEIVTRCDCTKRSE